ncbi:MAG: radical SAM protein [Polyangiaceae bacterium]|nr:radical SAM protein [Polyangiaceae bacterium]
MSERVSGTVLPKLVGAELELTTRCPCHCTTCGTAAGDARPVELSLARWQEVTRELVELGCQRVTLLGGEPLCFEGWAELARFQVELGLAVEIVTSGVTVDAEVAARVRDAGVASITVSVDGTREAHDRQRRVPAAFDRALRAIALLDAAGLRVGVTSQVNRLTLPTLEALAPELEVAGALGWQVQLTFPMGRAKDCGIELMPEDMPELHATLRRLRLRRGLRPFLTDSIGYCTDDDIALRTPQGGRARPWIQCLAGLRHIGIASNGDVKGCLALWDAFTEGNLEQEPLARIWRDPERFAYTRAFDRNSLAGPCADCPHGELCRGGCTAVAVAYHQRPGICTHCFRLFEAPASGALLPPACPAGSP